MEGTLNVLQIPPDTDSTTAPVTMQSEATKVEQGEQTSTTHLETSDTQSTSPAQDSFKFGTKSWVPHWIRTCYSDSFWTDQWSWEVVTILFSILCFTALVTVLTVYNGKTVPDLPFDITLNAIISLLATAMKSSLLLVVAAAMSQYRWLWLQACKSDGCKLYDIQLLDDASRGPWGALALLPYLRGRWIVAIGVVATVLSLLLETFVQQVPYYSQVPYRELSVLANVQRATGWISQEGETYAGRWKYPIQAAVSRGLYYSQISPLSPSCPRGNCSWPSFQTLAMCHRCVDVTDKIVVNGTCRLTVNGKNAPIRGGGGNESCDYRIRNHTIASGVMWTDGQNHQYGMEAMIVSPAGPISVQAPEREQWQPVDAGLDLPGWESPAFTFYRITNNWTASETNVASSSPVVEALKCSMNYCFQEYDLTLNGTILSTEKTIKAYANLDRTDLNGNVKWIPNHELDPTDMGMNNGFIVSNSEAQYTGNALALIIRGSVEGSHDIGLNAFTSDVMYAMYNTSLDKLLTNITMSVSQHILDPTQNHLSNGLVSTAGYVETYITTLTVRWAWLSLPVVVLVSAIIFLIITMFETRRTRVKIWKSSSLPLLYHGFDQPADLLSTLSNVTRMEDDAKLRAVQLSEIALSSVDQGWRLIPK